MCESATAPLRFAAVGPLPLAVDFLGGRLTSDGGLAWLAEADAVLGLTAALAAAIPDWRKRRGRHDLPTLVAQRVYQIACGYEDQDDADRLRTDPLLKHVCGRLPETGDDLASQPTFSRLENAIGARTCYRLAQALGAVYLRERERDGVPTHLVLDLDGTDDPTHGDQEGTPTTAIPAAPVLPPARLRRRDRPARSPRCCGGERSMPATGSWRSSDESCGRCGRGGRG